MTAAEIIAVLIGIPALLFALYHLGRRQQAVGCAEVATPAGAAPTKSASLVGVAYPWEPAGASPVTRRPVLWVRARKTVAGVGRNASSSSHSIGKVATTFLLVDETVPNASVAVESAKLRDVLVRTRFASSDGRLHDAGQGQLATAIRYVRHLTSSHGLEEKAIYPGDRLWVHGPLKDRGGYLGFGRRAWLDDRAPDDRVAWHTNFAAFGGVVVVLAALVVLVGQVW